MRAIWKGRGFAQHTKITDVEGAANYVIKTAAEAGELWLSWNFAEPGN